MVRPPYLIAILFLVLLSYPIFSLADETSFRGPWGKMPVAEKVAAMPSVQKEKASPSPLQGFALKGIRFFKKVISPTDGDRCPLYPSCSSYGAQAVRKHGFALGLIMTTARLTHELGETKVSPKIWVQGSYRFYDPLDNNDFWFTFE